MKTFLKKLTVFFLLLFVILIVMNIWMDFEPRPHYPLHYEEVFHPKVNANVVILGASHATHGINPRYLEGEHRKVFNFALNGAPPSFYLDWYQKVFRRYYPKPSYVIYAVHWAMFDDRYLARQFHHDSKYFPFRFFIRELMDSKSLQTLLFNRFSFSKERKHVIKILLREEREIYPKSRYYKGYIPFKTKSKKRLETGERHYEINPAQSRAFEELLDALKRDEIKVIFVQVPGYTTSRKDEQISEHVLLLRGIAKERRILFLDYETERLTSINMNTDLFADWTHLNEAGSEAFSTLLREDLVNLLNGI